MSEADPYLQPSGVLQNLAGITNGRELEAFERNASSVRLAQIDTQPLPGGYDLSHIRHFHRVIFGDVYAWAGDLRSVDIAKDDSRFTHARYLEGSFKDIERAIRRDLLPAGARSGEMALVAPGDIGTWARKAADVFADLNAWHGFREGNGRTSRAFVRQLGHEVGIDLQFERLNALEWRGASVLSFGGLNGQMQSLFERIAVPYERDRGRETPRDRSQEQRTERTR